MPSGSFATISHHASRVASFRLAFHAASLSSRVLGRSWATVSSVLGFVMILVPKLSHYPDGVWMAVPASGAVLNFPNFRKTSREVPSRGIG